MRGEIFRAKDVSVGTPAGVVILDRVGLTLSAGECLGLVGESGSGKSMLLRTLIGLVPAPLRVEGTFEIQDPSTSGMVDFDPMKSRGRDMGMVFQDPMGALNPARTIFWTLAEPLRRTGRLGRSELRTRVVELLSQVGIGDPDRVSRSYPHELSGGMRQRVLIAAVLANPPRVILCDEPTTALDTTTQARILNLLRWLKTDAGYSMIFVSHDLGVVSTIADRVAVINKGVIVEEGAVDDVLQRPVNPYTAMLVDSAPRLTRPTREEAAS